ncbi:MAG TPA: DUF1707 domain-containing protein [Streptosporangiaceae bacterium]|jgi:DNA-binding PadR family transcriptional regulator
MIHDPERLLVIATLAALPAGDAFCVSRLQDMTRLPPGRLVTRLYELGRVGYVRTAKTGGGRAQITIALTRDGRTALDRYTATLRQLPAATQAPAPDVRVGDADRDAAAAALSEHFAQGRLTLDELDARLDATLTAITHGELSQVTHDLPDLSVPSAQVSSARRGAARQAGWGP